MNILIKPKKNQYIIYAIIISLFTTIGMNISLMNTNADAILKRMEYNIQELIDSHKDGKKRVLLQNSFIDDKE